jgi:hypothetical protein
MPDSLPALIGRRGQCLGTIGRDPGVRQRTESGPARTQRD